MHFSTRVRRSCFVRLVSSRYLLLAAASKTQTSNSSRISVFLFETLLYFQTHKQKSNMVKSAHSNRSICNHADLDTRSYGLFSHNGIISRPEVLIFTRKTPCVLQRYHSNLDVQVYKLLLWFHLQPANQPTIKGWPFAITNLDSHCINVLNPIPSLYSSTVHCVPYFIQRVRKVINSYTKNRN